MKTCCGCIDMRKGVVTIGTIGLIASMLMLASQFILMALQKKVMLDETDKIGNNLYSFVMIMGIVVCFFKLISDCLLIFGAIKQTTREVSVWLAINLCTIIYLFITLVFIYDLLAVHKSNMDHQEVVILIVFLLTSNVCYLYLWYQVYIFSRQLDLDGRTSLEGILQNVTARP
ncbi:uncharacterized protein LOC116345718 [Contarinia nasturtii]|uniref:uncharacterized protein LOC116345718 n=1 Tax=Contarinia nasturtii TaxID=265458 RepID=UPI0012D40E87|nr:uncharacterized protein LOC116345718 [Contarinia nasturtii]